MDNTNYIKKGDTTIGIALTCKREFNARKIVTIAEDGTPYVQNTGSAENRRSIDIYCATKALRDMADDASNTAAMLTVNWRDSSISGYIEDNISWTEFRDEHGVGHFTLLVIEEE